MKYKPSKQDIEIIKRAAAREGHVAVSAVLLEPGSRHNIDSDRGVNINIALVTDDPDWADTDLHDYGLWSEFRAGIDLTQDGRGIVDFYIRKRNDIDGELLGNVSIEISGGKLTRVYGYGNKSDYFNAEAVAA